MASLSDFPEIAALMAHSDPKVADAARAMVRLIEALVAKNSL